MDVITRVRARTGKVFYGWWMLAIGSALYFVGMGSVFYGFSAFFNPMVAEFGWSSAVTSGAYSLSRLEGGVQGLVVGPLIDKFGARILMVVGFALTGIGFLVLPVVQTPLSLYLIFGLLITMGYSTACGLATTTLAANWFVQKRARAMSILYAVGGLGGAAIVPTFGLLIVHFGWRGASTIIGVVMLVVGIPLSIMVKSRPEDKGLLPDGGVEVPSSDTIPTAQQSGLQKPSSRPAERVEVDFTLKEVLRTQAFWMYGVAFVLRVCILSTIVIHEMPHLTNMGLSYEAAAGVLGAMILLSVPGRLVFGWLGDRYDNRRLLFYSCMMQAVGIWILIYASNLWMAYLFVIVFGFGYGASLPLSQSFRGVLFGRKTFGTVGGIVFAASTTTTVAAPIIAGYLYDTTGSYGTGFYIMIGIIILAGIAFLLIRYPKPPARLTMASGQSSPT